MLTHKITLPDGTEIEFFASDEATFAEQFGSLGNFPMYAPQNEIAPFRGRKSASKAVKQARKRQKQARRKQR